MKSFLFAGLAAGVLALAATAASAADPAHGQEVFRAQCGFCHQAGDGDGDGGQGPSLRGVIGRKIGGDPAFGGYTTTLSGSTDKWTESNLNTFLADPGKAMPGTAMPISMKDDTERADLIAYLTTLKADK
jgi:cytochrome c2